MTTRTDELFTKITDRLVETIETSNHGAWTKPWTTVIAASGIGKNASTEKAYQGFNQFILMVTAASEGYAFPLWATYKQWVGLGAQVRKGETGTTLVKWGVTYRCSGCDHKGPRPCTLSGHIPEEHWWASAFTVFNYAQQDGYEVELPNLGDEPTRLANVEAMVVASGAKIIHQVSNQAFYRPDTDQITLPERVQFATPEGYYGTALHELTHWTGHKSRLDRTTGSRFGDNAYAAEELVAELGATFLASHFGIEKVEPHMDHAAYLGSWLKVMKSDPKALYTTAKLAQSASEFLLGFALADDQTETTKEEVAA
jgi:antirestriction protein ArdC